MKVLVILNSISRKRSVFDRKILPKLNEHFSPVVWQTEYAGHAEELASKGVEEGFEVILSAGGDGTMHQVINGVMRHERNDVLFGLIPLGSGNDLARALGVTLGTDRIIDLISQRKSKVIDVALLHSRDEAGGHLTTYFINECSLGMGPEVVRRVNESGRIVGAGLMYLKSIVATFFFLSPEVIHVKADDLTWSGKSRVLAVANGKSFGHGIYIAPNSNMSDGLLNIFIASNPPLLRFLILLQTLGRPRESHDQCLTYATTARVEVKSDRPLPVEADGELAGYSPITCQVATRKVKFLC